MKIYTKTGDDGTTGLFGGGRVAKDDLRIETYGTVDELNAVIGDARAAFGIPQPIDSLLAEIQIALFVLGADLATPMDSRAGHDIPRITEGDVYWLESEIDKHESELPSLKRFILPGGSAVAARLHVARTVTRRAERLLVTLSGAEPIGEYDIQFLNRLSDLLFVLARLTNKAAGVPDVEWDGKQRPRV